MTTTDPITTSATTPLELLGGHAGLSYVDPSTVLSRLWYFDGKFLRAEGFRRDQAYVRNLVAVSNRAIGHGLVHGFTASKGTGDQIRVEAGLGLVPSGHPVLLTTAVNLSIAELIARSRGTTVGSKAGTFTRDPDFTRCPPETNGDGPEVVGPTPMWVLYATPIEALCGEEERFGQLCEDACSTETDRSLVIEGVCFFVEQLDLALPTSTTVSFTGRHLRSRCASAYYAWERARTASFISGTGLRSPIWCEGAAGVDGDAVALGVFDRAGEVTTFVDAWTARRELTTQSPERYWDWRMRRRPHDVLLAQVLQFQCQLVGLPTDPDDGGDDCADERDALTQTNELISRLLRGDDDPPDGSPAPAPGLDEVVGGFPNLRIGDDALRGLTSLRTRIVDVLAKRIPSPTGSILLDRGIVQLPPCGYLPVDAQRSVTEQVRAFMGRGVDLRFCAVRPDFIGEAMDEAQHLDRISLTQGMDDPGDLEEVDVLVPDGEIGSRSVEASDVFEGTFLFRPRVAVGGDGDIREGSALALATVAREQAGSSWSWTLAGFGETGDDADIPGLFGATLADAGMDAERLRVDRDRPVEVPFVEESEHRAHLKGPEFRQRMNRERYYAGARRSLIGANEYEAAFSGDEIPVIRDRKLRDGERRPLAMWFDLDLTRSLVGMGVGETAPATVRLVFYSRAKERSVLFDLRITGTLAVTDIVTGSSSAARAGATTVRTTLSGQSDRLVVSGSTTIGDPPEPISNVELVWQIGRTTTGADVLLVSMGRTFGERGSLTQSVKAKDEGDPRNVRASLSMTLRGHTIDSITTHRPDEQTQTVEMGRLEVDEVVGGFDASPTARSVAESAIDVIAAELAFPDRDPSFAVIARDRLLSPDDVVSEETEISGRHDWVFFHRRRTKECSAAVRPVRPQRRYQLLHAVVDDAGELARFRTLLGVRARSADQLPGFEGDDDLAARVREIDDLEYVRAHLPVGDLGFEPVTELAFEAGSGELRTPAATVRSAWRAADRGSRLLLGAVGDLGAGDGEQVAKSRLTTLRTTIQDLIDVQGTRGIVLDTVPPEFRTPGIDGVLLTVGLRPREVVVEGCVLLVRIDRKGLAVLSELFPEGTQSIDQPIDHIFAVLAEHGVEVDTLPAHFDGDGVLLDKDTVAHWWGPVPPAASGLLVEQGRVDSGDVPTDRARAETTGDLLGVPPRDDQEEIAITSAGDCDAVLFLVEGFEFNPNRRRFG